ncbi:hypothetical protein BGZ99_001228 [Dissophora globulifera]|uniref:F-box domain-containing protein n=1 Tax=Dissophora globulifera TaxID=979702 RepID=A0A9P6RWV0_9FUNG|nr:hypothetical protein BGZ99_001228 [Dissophora globulifera]
MASADPPLLGNPPATVAYHLVFSIPELVAQIVKYLRPCERLKLGLVSKTLHGALLPSLSLRLSADSVTNRDVVDGYLFRPEQLRVLGARIRSLTLVLTHDVSNPHQKAMLDMIYAHCANSVETLTIEYWGDDVQVLEQTLANFPSLQELSVRSMCSMPIKTLAQSLIKSKGCRQLRLLSVETIVTVLGDHLSVKGFEAVLRAFPRLTVLIMSKMSFVTSVREFSPPEDWFDSKQDYDPTSTSTSQLERLELSYCNITADYFNKMDELLPNLQALTMTGCSGPWLSVMTGESHASLLDAGLRTVFSQLKSLTLWQEFQTARANLLQLVEGRPHLTSLETDVLSAPREALLELAQFCSRPASTLQLKESGCTDEASRVNPQYKFKRLALQTYMSPAYQIEELEIFYRSPCFQTLDMFAFASNLTNLHLGGEESCLLPPENDMLNKILRLLPNLEILKIERYIDNYQAFVGLGREPTSPEDRLQPQVEEGAQKGRNPTCCVNWIHERPFLRELHLFVCLSNSSEAPVGDKSVEDEKQGLNLQAMREQVLDRFRFLETIKIQLQAGLRPPSNEDVESWKRRLEEKRGDWTRPLHITLTKKKSEDLNLLII